MRWITLNAAVWGTLLYLTTAAVAADGFEQPIELQPGMAKVLPVEGAFQSIVIGNPNLARVTVVNFNTIAIIGTGVGLTNIIVFNEEGKEILNRKIEIVGPEGYRAGKVREGRSIRILAFDSKGRVPDRRYLCADNCSELKLEQPPELNPPLPSNGGASSTITSETRVSGPPIGAQAGPQAPKY